MTEEPTNPPPKEPEIIARRSVDPDSIFQGMTATGIVTGGLGTFALGLSKLKETFWGKQNADEQTPPEPPPPEQES